MPWKFAKQDDDKDKKGNPLYPCKGAFIWDVFPKAIGISLTDQVDLFTGGFAGCTGVIITPKDKVGGLIAHITQSGYEDPKKKPDYFLQGTKGALALAKEAFKSSKFTLYLYYGTDGDPLMKDELEEDSPGIEFVDLRGNAYRDTTSMCYFRVKDKKLILLGAGSTSSGWDPKRIADTTEELEEESKLKKNGLKAKDGEMPFPLARVKKYKWRQFKTAK